MEQLAGIKGDTSLAISDSPPAHWKKRPLTSMRQASYLVNGENNATLDISLIALRGAAGHNLDNVNRWRSQLGLAAVDEAGFKQVSQSVETNFGPAVVVDLEGLAPGADPANDGRMTGVIADSDGDAWFFKLRGNLELARAEREGFLDWVRSVSVSPPASESNRSDNPSTVLNWHLPAGWTMIESQGSSRDASFTSAPHGGSHAEIAITHFPGDVGGDLANVNRWRQQAGLPPLDATELPGQIVKLPAGPNHFSVVDIKGDSLRLVAAWTRQASDTWFVKMTGSDELVGIEKTNFTSFVESLRFKNPE